MDKNPAAFVPFVYVTVPSWQIPDLKMDGDDDLDDDSAVGKQQVWTKIKACSQIHMLSS